MGQLIASAVLILSFLGLISLGCLAAGVTALFDGIPLWFGFCWILLGVLGLFSTYHHLMMAVGAYRKIRSMEDDE